MTDENEILNQLTRQTLEGKQVLDHFFRETLEADPAPLELTFFALSTSTIFYLQFGDQDDKKAILDRLATSVLTSQLSGSNGSSGPGLEEAHRRYSERIAQYSPLLTSLSDESRSDNPVLDLLFGLYENATGHSSRDQAFPTRKGAKILSRFLIDTIKYSQKTYGSNEK